MTFELMEYLKKFGKSAVITVLINKDVKAVKVHERVLVVHEAGDETLIQIFEINGFNDAILLHTERINLNIFRNTIVTLEFVDVEEDYAWQHFDGGWHNILPAF